MNLKRLKEKIFENKSFHDNNGKDGDYDHKMVSDSKTEPLAIKNDSIMIDDEYDNSKQ